MNASAPLVKIEHLSKQFDTDTTVLDDISLEIHNGQVNILTLSQLFNCTYDGYHHNR